MEKSVGIDRLGVYVPNEVLPITRLAEARQIAPEKLVDGLGLRAMSIAPPWEDSVTLAANAASRALAATSAAPRIDPAEIGLFIVATESAVDHAKPVAIFVHDLVRLSSACRTYEIKHACYGGTAALMSAAEWIKSGAARGRKALVIASDVARYKLGSAGEPTQGAGAVAMVVSENPSLLQLDFAQSGTFSASVYDFWRPLESAQALVDGKFSLECYLEALAGAFEQYRDLANERAGTEPGSPIADGLEAILYHTPFPKMASKAHRALVERDQGPESTASLDQLERLVRTSYERQVEPSLWAVRQVGNTYTASLYLCLAALLERDAVRLAGRRIGMFSYGSGCCAEFWSGVVAPRARDHVASIGLERMLARRRVIAMSEYEGWYRGHDLRAEEHPEAPPPEFDGPFFYAGLAEHQRRYGRAETMARAAARGEAA